MQGHPTNHDKPRVAIIGAGVIGLAIAWRLATRGVPVRLFDQGAAGMLAAVMEAEPGEEALVSLGRASQALWPRFAIELQDATGIDIELRDEGTLIVALTADDRARLIHQLALQTKLALPIEWINAAEARRREPRLSATLAGALWSPQDHQVDNRKLVVALRKAASAAGAIINEQAAVAEVTSAAGRATGVVLANGDECPADVVVLAAGAWSRGIGGLAPDLQPPVRPVKGQMLALHMDPKAPLVSHVVCAPGVYLVPRRGGRLLIGATVEEQRFDRALTAGGILTLLEAAWRRCRGSKNYPSTRCGSAIGRAAAMMRRSSAPGRCMVWFMQPGTTVTASC
jgi:glycine oxidase